MSLLEFILVRNFSHSDWIHSDTEYASVFSPNAEKIWTRKNPNIDTFYAVCYIPFSFYGLKILFLWERFLLIFLQKSLIIWKGNHKGKSITVFWRKKCLRYFKNHLDHSLGNTLSRNKFSLFIFFFRLLFFFFIFSQKISSFKSDKVCRIEYMELAMKTFQPTAPKRCP